MQRCCYALKYRKENRAVLSICGDGATSQGDFYEAMNVAGVWKLPVFLWFVIINGRFQCRVMHKLLHKPLRKKRLLLVFHGEQVDGNDVIAVQHRTAEALKRAREKNEPRLLEMVCYRQHDHTTADDASRYEPKNIREQEWKKEPIVRLRRYLENIRCMDRRSKKKNYKQNVQQKLMKL